MARVVREASCRSLALLVSMMEAQGRDTRLLVDGLPVELFAIRDPSTWLDWESFAEILDRCQELSGGPDEWVEVQRRMTVDPVARPLRSALGLAASPHQLYRLVFDWLGPSLFPVHRTALTRTGEGRLNVVLTIPEHRRGCIGLLGGARGTCEALPRILGLPDATVTGSASPHLAEYSIVLPPSGGVRSRMSRMVSIAADIPGAVDELTRQQAELQRSYEELEAEMAERVRAEQAMRELEDQQRQSHKMEALGRLAGGIAHDFNNLLTAVTGFASMLHRHVDDAEGHEYIDEIEKAAERAAGLTRQLLAFSRHQPGRPRSVELHGLLRSMEALLVRLAGAEVDISLELAPGLPHIRIDASQLEQIVVNLVVNARDATSPGGRVSVTTELVPGDMERARIVVEDDGTGMDAEVKARAFDPFFTTKRESGGSGLGLATVYGIVRDAGGEIRLETEPGVGTRVIVELPTTPPEASSASAPEPEISIAHEGARVLVIEDEDVVRRLVSTVLRRAGFEVFVAADRAEALRCLRDEKEAFDAVLSDVMLDGDRGPLVVAALRDVQPALPAVYMSGYHELGDDIALDGPLVAKPFAGSRLVDVLAEVLGESRKARR